MVEHPSDTRKAVGSIPTSTTKRINMKKIKDPTRKVFLNAIKWLNKNQERVIKYYTCFDYPDYCGLPSSIAGRLYSDEVDYIQEETFDWFPKEEGA